MCKRDSQQHAVGPARRHAGRRLRRADPGDRAADGGDRRRSRHRPCLLYTSPSPRDSSVRCVKETASNTLSPRLDGMLVVGYAVLTLVIAPLMGVIVVSLGIV